MELDQTLETRGDTEGAPAGESLAVTTGEVVEGEVLPARLDEPPTPSSLATAARAAVWQPKGKAAEGLARALAGYDPDGKVSADAAEMFDDYALAENTKYAYTYQLLRFVVWCGDKGYRHLPESGEPVELWMPEMVANCRNWVADNYSMRNQKGVLRGNHGQPFSPDTVRLSLAAIAKLYERRGFQSPTHHVDVKDQMRAYARKWARAKYRRDIAYVVSWDEMISMVRSCDLNSVAGLRDAFLIRLAAETGRRNSELMSLDWGNITSRGPAVWKVDVPISKTNQEGDRDDFAIVEADLDLEPELDTIALGTRWREVCQAQAAGWVAAGEPIFRKCRGGASRADGSMSGVVRPDRMDRKNYQDVVTAAGHRSGVLYDPMTGEVRKLVPHSFRAYMATESTRAGLPLGSICDQGGWNRNSPVVLRYQRLGSLEGENNPGHMIRERRRQQRAAQAASAQQERDAALGGEV